MQFHNVHTQAIRENCTNDHIQMALCGNKVDLTKAGGQGAKRITTEVGQAYASSQGMLFFETSAKEDINVGMMFRSTAREVLKRVDEGKITVGDAKCGVKMEDYAPASRSVSAPEPRRKRGCC
jgi:GTPase SAR1 family protein